MAERQRGVALITALIVVALATIAAVAMASRQRYDIRRTANLMQLEQAYQYGLGVEAWAGQVLRRDRRDNKVDSLGEAWATVLPPLKVEQGSVAGHIADLQGRFNLNDLVRSGHASAPDVARFRRLLAVLGLDPGLASAVVDWIDPDPDPSVPGGAEDGVYLGRTPAYRAANRPFASVSELRLVAGFDAKAYRALAPFVAALPAPTAINVNTAPLPVLQCLAAGLSEADAKALAAGRGDQGYASVADFLQQPAFAGRRVDGAGLDVASHYFVVTSTVQVGRVEKRYRALLMRASDGSTTTLMRTQGTL